MPQVAVSVARAISRTRSRTVPLYAPSLPNAPALVSAAFPVSCAALFRLSFFQAFYASTPSLTTEQGAHDVHLSNLPFSVTVKQLEDFYQSFGPVAGVKLAKRASDSLPLGWAVVTLKNAADAQNAAQETDGKRLKDRIVSASISQPDEAPCFDSKTTVFVSNLSPECTPQELRLFYSAYGTVLEVFVRTVRRQCRWTAYAFLRFATTEAAERARLAIANSMDNPEDHSAAPATFHMDATTANGSDVFVNCLPPRATATMVGNFFLQFGDVTGVYLPRYMSGKLKGHGFVSFRTIHDARWAAGKANGTWFMHRKLDVMACEPISDSTPSNRKAWFEGLVPEVKVTNIHSHATEEEVYEVLQQFGHIQDGRFQNTKAGRPLEYGFVRFVKFEDAERAVAKGKDLKLHGVPLNLELNKNGRLRLNLLPLSST